MTLHHPKMYLHTKFGVPISKNIGDMHQTQCSKFLETRSEVKFKVAVTQLWYTTLYHPMMHHHTKFEMPTSNYTVYSAQDYSKNKVRGQDQGHSARKWYATLRHP